MLDWIRDNDALLIPIGIFSALCVVATLIAIPVVIIRMPSDYFTRRRRSADGPRKRSSGRMVGLILKNAAGVILIAAGIAMLILPGQGVLTILIGLFVMDFPGKYALEKRLVRRPGVLRALNWIRRKANKPPLQVN